MSLALTATAYPSKKLRKYAILFSLLLILVGVFIAELPHLSVLARVVLATACFAVSGLNYFKINRLQQCVWQITIDSKGEIHCRRGDFCPRSLKINHVYPSNPYQLMHGTTLWHRTLFLRLRRLNDDEMINLVILSDALTHDEFRRLAIACHWIDAHGNIGH